MRRGSRSNIGVTTINDFPEIIVRMVGVSSLEMDALHGHVAKNDQSRPVGVIVNCVTMVPCLRYPANSLAVGLLQNARDGHELQQVSLVNSDHLCWSGQTNRSLISSSFRVEHIHSQPDRRGKELAGDRVVAPS